MVVVECMESVEGFVVGEGLGGDLEGQGKGEEGEEDEGRMEGVGKTHGWMSSDMCGEKSMLKALLYRNSGRPQECGVEG